jgi:2-dehydro-3-deoxygluconokinase
MVGKVVRVTQAVVCFGELLVRMSAPGHERLLQSPWLNIAIGGAEANVAVSLARFGHKAKMASIVADNELGASAVGELKKHGVDTNLITKASGRMGLYFLSSGAVTRPSAVLYDRADSAFVQNAMKNLDIDAILAGVKWLHVSGVTPAVGRHASDAALTLVEAAIDRGVKVSFDGNYRAQLWAARANDGPDVLRRIVSCATLAFINERDIELILQATFEDRQAAFAGAFKVFPKLQWIAATSRELASVSHQTLSGELISRDGRWASKSFAMPGIVDRIGAGDAFAAGLLHGFLSRYTPQDSIDFAVGAAVVKHSIPGDFNLTSISEVNEVLLGGSIDVRR